jgi:hypothetical protein
MAKSPRPRMEINLEEIYQILHGAQRGTHERGQLREESAGKGKPAKPGHGRNGASGIHRCEHGHVAHATLSPGDLCPERQKRRVHRRHKPETLIRITGRPPLEATVYEMEHLRCNGCRQLFTAEAPRRKPARRSMARARRP